MSLSDEQHVCLWPPINAFSQGRVYRAKGTTPIVFCIVNVVNKPAMAGLPNNRLHTYRVPARVWSLLLLSHGFLL